MLFINRDALKALHQVSELRYFPNIAAPLPAPYTGAALVYTGVSLIKEGLGGLCFVFRFISVVLFFLIESTYFGC